MNLPSHLRDARNLVDSFDLKEIEKAVAQEARAKLVIIGPVNSGKSTLFNQLKGQKLSQVSAVPGTTTSLISERFGPFSLVDTPGFGEVTGEQNAAVALSALDAADTVLLVLDASSGIRQADAELLREVRQRGVPVVVVLNKLDLIKKDKADVIRDAERKLGVPVIAISAKTGENIARKLIPAIIDSHPRMAVTVGRALPLYRRQAAGRIIRESAVVAGFISFEPVPGLAIPLLIGTQVRMLLRLSVIYGEDMSLARARELISAIAGGMAIRYAAQELAKLIPVAGWITASIVGVTGTLALGRVAVIFFETGQQLSQTDLRQLYKRMRWRKPSSLPPEPGELGPDYAAGPTNAP